MLTVFSIHDVVLITAELRHSYYSAQCVNSDIVSLIWQSVIYSLSNAALFSALKNSNRTLTTNKK